MPDNNEAVKNNMNIKNDNAAGKNNNKIIIAAVAALVVIAAVIVTVIFVNKNRDIKDITIGAAYDYEDAGFLKLGDYKGINVSVAVSDEDVEEGVNDALDSVETYVHKEGTPVQGDSVNVDYTATLDGNDLEDYASSDEILEVGSEDNFTEFNNELVTMTTGETKSVEVKVPDDYGDDEIDGKTVVFNITLNYICGDEIDAELTDEFANEYSEGECTSAADFKEYMRKSLYEEKVDSIADDAWESVVDNTEVEKVAKGELDNAVKETMDNYKSFAELSGCSVDELLESFGMTEDDAKEVGEDTAKDRMIAKTIAAKENITMDDATYQSLLISNLVDDTDGTDNMSVAELEDAYTSQYAENPKEAMFLECVKKFVADNAVVEGLEN